MSTSVDEMTNEAFQQAWAKANTTKDSMKLSVKLPAWAAQLIVWTSALLTLAQATDPSLFPKPVENLIEGSHIFVVLLYVFGAFSLIIVAICCIITGITFRSQVNDRDTDIRKNWAKADYRNLLARSFKSGLTMILLRNITITAVQVTLFYAGGAFLTATLLLILWIITFLSTLLSRYVVRDLVKNVITPENVKWLESSDQ